MTTDGPRWDLQPLIPAIVQDLNTRQVLMIAFMNQESYRRTLESGQAWFWSRRRNELWHKGATSGHFLNVRGVSYDCDGDAILLLVEPEGETPSAECYFFSGFVMQFGREWFWVTAGHIMKDIESHLSGGVAKRFRLIDNYGSDLTSQTRYRLITREHGVITFTIRRRDSTLAPLRLPPSIAGRWKVTRSLW